MKFNDIHVHIAVDDVTFRPDFDFNKFLSESQGHIDNAVVFLNPITKKFYPPQKGVLKNSDRVRVRSSRDHQVEFFNGNGIIFTTPQSYMDPYREQNEALLDLCRPHKNLHPFLYLTLNDDSIAREIKYFEENHAGEFYGLKVHPNLTSKKMSEMHFDSHLPLIIHSGVEEYDDPNDILEFAKNYSGKVIIAHYARWERSALEEIAKLDNVYIDTSPSYMPGQIVNKTTDKYTASEITDVADTTTLFKNLIDIVGEDKIIFGTDAPWGNFEEASELMEELDLPSATKDKIFKTNYENVLGLDLVQQENDSLEDTPQEK